MRDISVKMQRIMTSLMCILLIFFSPSFHIVSLMGDFYILFISPESYF